MMMIVMKKMIMMFSCINKFTLYNKKRFITKMIAKREQRGRIDQEEK